MFRVAVVNDQSQFVAENAGRCPSTCQFKDTPVPGSGSPSRSAQGHPSTAAPQCTKGTKGGVSA